MGKISANPYLDRLKQEVLDQARQIMETHGFESLPTLRELDELGYSSLRRRLETVGGLKKIRQELSPKRRLGVWTLPYTIAEASEFMRENGYAKLPNAEILRAAGRSDLANGISRNGGFPKFREIFGEEIGPSWRDLGYCLAEARKMMADYGFEKLPSARKLEALGYSSLVAATYLYHSGLQEFRRALGERIKPPKKLHKSQYDKADKNFVLRWAKEVRDYYGFEKLPTSAEFRELGYNSLLNRIYGYGGLVEFRNFLGEIADDNSHSAKGVELEGSRRNNLQKDDEYILAEGRKLKEQLELDKLPNMHTLKELGYATLAKAIQNYHGGLPGVRKLLGESNSDWQKS